MSHVGQSLSSYINAEYLLHILYTFMWCKTLDQNLLQVEYSNMHQFGIIFERLPQAWTNSGTLYEPGEGTQGIRRKMRSHETPQPMSELLPLKDTLGRADTRENTAFRGLMVSSISDTVVSGRFPNQCKEI